MLIFDSATSPTAFWIPIADLNLNAGQPVGKLTVAGGRTYSGNASARFQPAQPFPFLSEATRR